jgi:hypothetical protein
VCLSWIQTDRSWIGAFEAAYPAAYLPFVSNQNLPNMKKLLWSVAAVGLLATGCSKEEVEEHVTEGVSALATPVGGSAKSNNNGGTWNFHVWNEAWFNQGQGSL